MEVPNNSSTPSSDIDNDGMASLSQELQQQATTIICRGNLPKEAVEDLKKWLFQHFHYPYPNDAEKEKLMAQTGLTLTQVNNWFINARRRIWKPIVQRRTKDQINKKMQQFTASSVAAVAAVNVPNGVPMVPPVVGTIAATASSSSVPTAAPGAPLGLMYSPQQGTPFVTPFPPAGTMPGQVNQANSSVHHLVGGPGGAYQQHPSTITSPPPSASGNGSSGAYRIDEESVVATVGSNDDTKDKVSEDSKQTIVDPFSIEALTAPDSDQLIEEYMRNPLREKMGKNGKRTFEEAFVDENYNQMLDEYNRLRKENNSLKTEFKKLNTNYQKLLTDMSKRHQTLTAKLAEMEHLQEAFEAVNAELTSKLHEKKKAKLSLPKPMALRKTYEKRKDNTDEGPFKPLTKSSSKSPRFRSLETNTGLLQAVSSSHDNHRS